MSKKDSFILYTDQKAVINKLTDEQAGKILKALYQYADTGQMLQLDTTLDLVITPFITTMDRDKIKYEKTCRVRAEAGSKGRKAKGSKC